MIKRSPILTAKDLQMIYRNVILRNRFQELEDKGIIRDESADLRRLVNFGQSSTEAMSRWVRYREGYSPKIVERILSDFPLSTSKCFVLDPMCGSGSTQVAAQGQSILSAGGDVSPYAVLVSRVKTQRFTKVELANIEKFTGSIRHDNQYYLNDFSETELYLQSYFNVENFSALIAIKRAIGRRFSEKSNEFAFLWTAMLAIVEACSNRKKDGNGLITRASRVASPLDEFLLKVNLMINDVRGSRGNKARSISFLHSALEVDTLIRKASRALNAELGAIIFSPPYVNSFDYFESYKLELLFGNFFTVTELPIERKRLIRSYRQTGKSHVRPDMPLIEMLITEVMERLPEKESVSGAKDTRSRLLPNLLRGYFQDMRMFVEKASSVMVKGSYMAIIVDQSAYLGVLIPTDLLLADIGKTAGLSFEQLIICRRAKTSGQQLVVQPALGNVLRESVVILRK